jgi:hypothetical protein
MALREKAEEVLKQYHDSPATRNFDTNKRLAKVQQQFDWTTRRQDIEERCGGCKASSKKPEVIPTPS